MAGLKEWGAIRPGRAVQVARSICGNASCGLILAEAGGYRRLRRGEEPRQGRRGEVSPDYEMNPIRAGRGRLFAVAVISVYQCPSVAALAVRSSSFPRLPAFIGGSLGGCSSEVAFPPSSPFVVRIREQCEW